jgi:hypothetical protein
MRGLDPRIATIANVDKMPVSSTGMRRGVELVACQRL